MAKSLTFTTIIPQRSSKIATTQQDNKRVVSLVLIHGWGLNSDVWQTLVDLFLNENDSNKVEELQIITVDLPGFGRNSQLELEPYSLINICKEIDNVITHPAIYLGWSLGGLVATTMALNHPDKVLGLITVASSPNFTENVHLSDTQAWPGIKSDVLATFYQQLSQDIKKTLTNFLKIQAMGSPHIRQDIKKITQLVMQHKLPTQRTLENSLKLLSTTDLRQQLVEIQQPFLRLYGANDSLVPKNVINLVNTLAPNSEQYIFPEASHAPFISHANDFYKVLSEWIAKHFTV